MNFVFGVLKAAGSAFAPQRTRASVTPIYSKPRVLAYEARSHRSATEERPKVRNPSRTHYVAIGLISAVALTFAVLGPARGGNLPVLPPLTKSQIKAMNLAYDFGGWRLVAVVWQESDFCVELSGDGGRAFGCGQLHAGAARFVLGHYVREFDWRHSRPVNLVVANSYLRSCEQLVGWPDALFCYNAGAYAAIHTSHAHRVRASYVREVLVKLSILKSLPEDKQ